jgi:hypothetical protein
MDLTEGYLSSTSDILTFDSLLTILIESDFKIQSIISKLGLDRYLKYRLVIYDICQSRLRSMD